MEEESERRSSIDRGWAWVITMAVFGCNILCVGYHRAFGVFFVEIIDTFGSSASMTSLIVGIQFAVFCITALLVHNVLLELVTIRTSAMMGGLVMASGMMLGMFAYNLPFLIFCLSALVGMGNAMIYGPGFVLLGQYFERRRAIAMSLSNAGASVGGMVLPVLATHLVTHYGLRPALLLYGAVTLHLCVFASLYRPLAKMSSKQSPVTSETDQTEDSSVALLPGKSAGQGETPQQAAICENRPAQHAHMDSSNLDLSPKNLVKIPDIAVDKCESMKTLNDVVFYETESLVTNPIYSKKPQNKHLNADYFQRVDGVSAFLFSSTGNMHLEDLKLIEEQDLLARRSLTVGDLRMSPIPAQIARAQGKNTSLGNLLLRKLGSLQEAAVYASQPHLPVPVPSYSRPAPSETSSTSDADSDAGTKVCSRRNICSYMICDMKLLKNPLFWLVQAYCCVGVIGASGAGSYVPSLCAEKGLAKDQTAIVLTTWGACNLVGRLAGGIVADRKWLRPSRISTLAFLVIGLLFQLVSVLPHTFPSLMTFGVLYGLFEGTYFTMLPLIIIDFVSMDNFSRTFGFVQLSQGAFATVAYPILGSLRDYTGNYHATFHLLGACALMASLLLLLEPLVRALKWGRPRDVILSSDKLKSFTEGKC